VIYFFFLAILFLFTYSCKLKKDKEWKGVDNLSFIPLERYGPPPKRNRTYKPIGRRLKAQCYTREMIVHFCEDSVLSDRIQHRSKIRVVSLKTGRSLTFIVSYDRNVKGLCIPERFKYLMGGGTFFRARVYVLRCGENGRSSCPEEIRGYASWYGHKHHGYPMASGFKFNKYDFIAAHRWLPFGSVLLVENLKNGKKVKVTVWDRGPYVSGRELDLSYGAAKELDMLKDGVVPFRAKVLRCGN